MTLDHPDHPGTTARQVLPAIRGRQVLPARPASLVQPDPRGNLEQTAHLENPVRPDHLVTTARRVTRDRPDLPATRGRRD